MTHSFIKKGPSTVEDPIAMAMTVDGILGAALLAEKEKADAVVIDCTADPGISEARHAVSIPVIGAMRVALSLASDLATRTGIIFPSRNAFPVARNLYRSYADTSCIPMAATDQLVRDLTAENDSTPQALFEASLLLADENECGAIILGCTGYSPFAQTLRDRLSGIGTDIAVIDPVSVAIFTAAAMTWENTSHSKRCFPFPRKGSSSATKLDEIRAAL